MVRSFWDNWMAGDGVWDELWERAKPLNPSKDVKNRRSGDRDPEDCRSVNTDSGSVLYRRGSHELSTIYRVGVIESTQLL